MATPSPRNFSQYSGLDRFKQMQTMPSTLERLQNPSLYGPGSERDQLLKSQYSWALPLSERPATAVGRSYNDPERVMERKMRDDNGPERVMERQMRDDNGPSYRHPGGFGQSGGMGFPSLGGLGASLKGQLQQSMDAGAAYLSIGGATKGAGRKMVANAMFPNTKGYFY